MIKIIGSVEDYTFFVCEYQKDIGVLIKEMLLSEQIKLINNLIYIKKESLGCFVELLQNNKITFEILTTLNKIII